MKKHLFHHILAVLAALLVMMQAFCMTGFAAEGVEEDSGSGADLPVGGGPSGVKTRTVMRRWSGSMSVKES